jgi:hypothetical protein
MASVASEIQYWYKKGDEMGLGQEEIYTDPIYIDMTEKLLSGILDANEKVVTTYIIDYIAPTIIKNANSSSIPSDIIDYLKDKINIIIANIKKNKNPSLTLLRGYMWPFSNELNERLRGNTELEA